MGLCWIDDDAASIREIKNTVFYKFWRELDHFDVSIRLFGDDYMESLSEQEKTAADIAQIQGSIQRDFREICFSIDKEKMIPIGDTYRIKKDNMKIDCKGISCQEREIKALLDPWRLDSNTSSEGFDYTSYAGFQTECKSLVQRLDIPAEDVVAMDICLLQKDIYRCKNKLPLLSMALHHYLKHTTRNCFLYSRMLVNEQNRQNWKTVYKTIYNEEPPEIYNRFGFRSNDPTGGMDVLYELLKKTKGERTCI